MELEAGEHQVTPDAPLLPVPFNYFLAHRKSLEDNVRKVPLDGAYYLPGNDTVYNVKKQSCDSSDTEG